MGKIIRKCIDYGGSSNSAENIKYDDTKNVKEAINEVDNLLGNTDISAIGDGTVTGGIDALNSNLNDVVTIIGATLNSLTVAANGYGNMSQDISSFIPNGYKCIGACFASSGSAWFIPVAVYLIGTSVQVYVKNTYTGQDQGAPIINLICIRN